MNRQSCFSVLVIEFLVTCALGNKSSGIELSSEISSSIVWKLKSVVHDCASKGVLFDSKETNATITNCVELFNEVGQQEHKDPHIKNLETQEGERQYKGLLEARNVSEELRIKYSCNQLSSTFECMEPVKRIVEKCKSPEGIAFFSIAEEVCKNDRKPIIAFSSELDKCGKSRKFEMVYQSCTSGPEGNGIEVYFGRKPNVSIAIYEFCNFGTLFLKCFQRALDAEPKMCSKTSELLHSFVEGAKKRAMSSLAETKCII